MSKKIIVRRSIFLPLKSGRKKCLERTSVFRTPKLCQKMYVRSASIIGPSKLHRKSTSFGNSLISFAKYWHAINSQSTSIWCDVVSIGFEKKKKFYSNLEKMCVQVFFSLGIVNANNANDYKVRFRAHCYVPIFQWQILKAYASMRYLSHVSRW